VAAAGILAAPVLHSGDVASFHQNAQSTRTESGRAGTRSPVGSAPMPIGARFHIHDVKQRTRLR